MAAEKKKNQKNASVSVGATGPKILGIIPARGGSKGVPRKNIRPLGGKPLLTYMLSAALKSNLLSRVVVSSEDEEILDIAERYGGEDVPLKRPKRLAEDTTPDVPMLQHAVRAVERADRMVYDYVVQLHATTPFLDPEDIDAALRSLIEHPEADSVVSVFQVNEEHPIKMKKIVGDRLAQYISDLPELSTERRQDFEPVYRRNGGLYASKRHVVMEMERVFGDYCLPYVMSDERSVEIDNMLDLVIAEAVLKHLKKSRYR